ncbi:hypothetical protein RHS01_02333 [Rhizoctonia solani]|uniref:MARVEL domain-containing protein n=1 Tax=Rhizoctonia solani TaxID=456999 RepID=A0A8H7IIH8_9AGAM|nr:hypothetical protein RHS01_02333 [Rhizoctonia solani]
MYSNQQPGYAQQPVSTYTPPAQAYAQSQPQVYTPNSAYPQHAPSLPPPPPHGANRQMSLPLNVSQGPSAFVHPPSGHAQQQLIPCLSLESSIRALSVCVWRASSVGVRDTSQWICVWFTGPESAELGYPSQPPANYPSQPAHQPQPASNYNPKPPVRAGTANVGDFIDVGPFTYSGIREMSPPPKRQESPQRPVRQESPQRPRHESPLRHESPQRRNESPQRPQAQSPPPTRGHLPWASENTNTNDQDLGDPDLVYPPSTPNRNDANSFPFNVQAAQEAASQGLSSIQARGEEGLGCEDGEWGQPGDVNEDGKLISNGPRKRMAVRALEVLCAIGAVIACIYAFAVPKPNPAAPPASKPAVYVIVVLGFGTIFVFAYIYIIRGLFGVGVNKDDPYAHAMVLPISRHRPGQSKKHKNQSSVQVNLIVPSVTSPNRESNLTPGVPWSEQQASSNNVFTSYEREKARLSARRGLWWALGLDVLGALAWGTGFVLAMVGPRCPVGGYSGWCDAFNGAVACSCIGCVLFIASGVLVGRDLFASRRTDRKLGRY